MKHQYYCPSCNYHREGLLDHPAIGIGSYSTTCPECGESYISKEIPSACACLGPQGNDPVCPCRMRDLGKEPSNTWTKEKKEDLNKVLSEIFGWKK